MVQECGAPTKDGTPCRAPVMTGKDYCYSHRPEAGPVPSAAVEPVAEGDLGATLATLVGDLALVLKKLDDIDERVKVVEGRQDVYQKMLEQGEKVKSGWKPTPKERYPSACAKNPNDRWVMVTPMVDGEVTRIVDGTHFTVEFRKGHAMGTYTGFADEARAKGIIP
ncbi:MAG: hypothetical protein GTO63_37415 [Anaerolineae bacterium]|nr:hypothetical protein [Anaerolineae bacterium]NIO00443.1 hypothetical protein [Anaerolineae bacterium]NIQ83203.1 hypothetical protein [Anaerolineae bacterium]